MAVPILSHCYLLNSGILGALWGKRVMVIISQRSLLGARTSSEGQPEKPSREAAGVPGRPSALRMACPRGVHLSASTLPGIVCPSQACAVKCAEVLGRCPTAGRGAGKRMVGKTPDPRFILAHPERELLGTCPLVCMQPLTACTCV